MVSILKSPVKIDHAHRRVDGEGHGVVDGVVDVNQLHAEAARLEGVAGLVGNELGGAQQMVLLQLELDQSGGQARRMDGGMHLLQDIGQRADMILVAVGQGNGPQLMLVLDQIAHVGDDQIHAEHIVVREPQAAVDDQHVIPVLQHGHVHANLAQATQGDNFQFFSQIFQLLIIRARRGGSSAVALPLPGRK